MIDVVETVAEMADWDRKRPKGVGLGIAHSRSLGSYVATVVEVDARGPELVIPAIYVAMDAGTIVNPDAVVAQCEGGSIFGLSCALGEITVRYRMVEQSSLRDFEVVRMSNAPKKIEVRLLENNQAPGGVGEAPTPTVAPALCNAIFAATGNRIRQLPIKGQWRPKG